MVAFWLHWLSFYRWLCPHCFWSDFLPHRYWFHYWIWSFLWLPHHLNWLPLFVAFASVYHVRNIFYDFFVVCRWSHWNAYRRMPMTMGQHWHFSIYLPFFIARVSTIFNRNVSQNVNEHAINRNVVMICCDIKMCECSKNAQNFMLIKWYFND